MKRLFCIALAMMLLCVCAFAEDQVAERYAQLEKGSKGNSVVELQNRLKELGFYSGKVDGDYGNGTVKSVKAFEEYNDLEATGVATPELQALLFSDDAKGIEIPDIEITAINLKMKYNYYFARPTFVNHTDATIDGITYMVKVYNTADERIGYQVLTLEDVCRYENSDDYQKETSTGEVNGMKIKPGAKYSVGSSNEIDFYNFDENLINKVLMAVTRYHTVDGENVSIAENDQIWYGSDGSVVSVEYENNIKPVAELTNEIEDEADSFDLGIDFRYIDNFFAEVVGIPVGGCYVSYVYDDSPASESGLKTGDIVVKIGDIWVKDEMSLILAKGLMEEEEPTQISFYRRGELRETEITR